MARSIPQRLAWAMDTMAISPAHHVLEIGCGRGLAASLVCQRLTSGRLVAIDRSLAAVKAAEARNADSVAAGRAEFLAVPLVDADLAGARFDKVFAVNVNLFWVRSSVRELELIRRLLEPPIPAASAGEIASAGGGLYLFYEPPRATRARAVADKVSAFLAEEGFSATTLSAPTRPEREVVCVVARPEVSGRSGTGRTRA